MSSRISGIAAAQRKRRTVDCGRNATRTHGVRKLEAQIEGEDEVVSPHDLAYWLKKASGRVHATDLPPLGSVSTSISQYREYSLVCETRYVVFYSESEICCLSDIERSERGDATKRRS